MPRILASLLLLASPSGSQDQLDETSARVVLSYFGSPVTLDETYAAQLEREMVDFLAECHTYAAVTGAARPPEELESLWRRQENRGLALIETRGGPEYKHLHLRERDYVLMLGLEAGQGVGPVLTRHSEVLTSYVKCPGLEAIALSCRLHERIPSVDPWPDCDRVDQLSSEGEGQSGGAG